MKIAGAIAVLVALSCLSDAEGFGHRQRCRYHQPRAAWHRRLWNNPTVRHLVSIPGIPLEFASEQASRLLNFFEIDPPTPNEDSGNSIPDVTKHDQNLIENRNRQDGSLCHNVPSCHCGKQDNDEHVAISTEPENQDISHPDNDNHNKNARGRDFVEVAKQWIDWMKQMDWDGNDISFFPFLTDEQEQEVTEESEHDHRYSEMLKKKEALESKLMEEQEAIHELEREMENEQILHKQREQRKRLELERQRKEEEETRREQERLEGERLENEQRELENQIQKEQERIHELRKQQESLRQQQNNRHFPKTELFSLQVPNGYSPRDLKVRTRGPEVKIDGKRVCGCDEGCVFKEFSRSFKLPVGMATESLQATFYGDGHLSIEGDTHHQVNTVVDTDIPIKRIGYIEDTDDIKERLECLRSKSGFKISQMDSRTGKTYPSAHQENAVGYKRYEAERGDDGVTIEVVEE